MLRGRDLAELSKMSCEEAENEIYHAVYAATRLLEDLEMVGLVWGNGHHNRQNIAALAKHQLRENWKEGE